MAKTQFDGMSVRPQWFAAVYQHGIQSGALLHSPIVVLNYFAKVVEATVVHVWRSNFYISQSWRFENAAVSRIAGALHQPFGQYLGVIQSVVAEAFRDGFASRVRHQVVAVGTIGTWSCRMGVVS